MIKYYMPFDMVRYYVIWCGVVWCDVMWCGVVWCGVVWFGVVWCGVMWCGVVWCVVCGVAREGIGEVRAVLSFLCFCEGIYCC